MRILATTLLLGPSFAVADPFYWDIPPDQDVVILGEVHDNPLHHHNQAEAIAALQPAAVVFEMLDQQDAVVANDGHATLDDFAAALNWDTSGWPPFDLYRPIFEAMASYGWTTYPPFPADPMWGESPVQGWSLFNPTAAHIYGADVPSDEARQAIEQGAAATFGPGADLYGLQRPLPETEQTRREQGQLDAHCGALPNDMLPGFVAAQRLRDARLAQMVVRAMQETDGLVVVITGNGHARSDWGVPAVLQQVDPSLTVFSVGQIEGGETDMPFDLIVETEAIDRPDPCAAFQN